MDAIPPLRSIRFAVCNAIRTVFCALVLNLLLGIGAPPVLHALYVARLLALAPPARLAVPVDQVPAAAVRNSWHAPRDGGSRRHEGIDIFAPRGTPVRATTQGIVSRMGNNRLGGKVVWVLGPAGQRHYYAHLDSYADISPGQRIEAGTLLGYVGNTGNAAGTPSHLHYGIYSATGPVNPFPLLTVPKDPQSPVPARRAQPSRTGAIHAAHSGRPHRRLIPSSPAG